MAQKTTVDKYGLKIKFKQHFNLFGRVDEKFVCETERVVHSTNTMTTEEYLESRVYAMLLDSILRFEIIDEIFCLLESHSIKNSKFSLDLYNSIKNAPSEIISCINGFKNDLLKEMHDTEEDVIKYMQENEKNYELGLKGGGNLKYSNMLWIDCFELTFNWVFKTLRKTLNHIQEANAQVDNIEKYLRTIYVDRFNSKTPTTILEKFDYDIISWTKSKKFSSIKEFAAPVEYNFTKTRNSDVDPLTIWQDLGFKLDKKRDSNNHGLAGFYNRFYLSNMRRKVESFIVKNKIDNKKTVSSHT